MAIVIAATRDHNETICTKHAPFLCYVCSFWFFIQSYRNHTHRLYSTDSLHPLCTCRVTFPITITISSNTWTVCGPRKPMIINHESATRRQRFKFQEFTPSFCKTWHWFYVWELMPTYIRFHLMRNAKHESPFICAILQYQCTWSWIWIPYLYRFVDGCVCVWKSKCKYEEKRNV